MICLSQHDDCITYLTIRNKSLDLTHCLKSGFNVHGINCFFSKITQPDDGHTDIVIAIC